MNLHNKTWQLVILAMFSAIIILMAFTPIGFIPLPHMRATTIHIPVIVGSLLLGPKFGGILGFMFGCVSLINNTINPNPMSFVFSPFYSLPGQDGGSWFSLIIVFVPRILVGVTPWFVSQGLKKLMRERFMPVNWVVSGVVGSLTNTLLVMHLIFFLFGEDWNNVRGGTTAIYAAILGVIAINGVPEAIVAGVIVAALMGALTASIGARGGQVG
ncbi:MAG: ECF transporter S component [Defluviitaleaceae bacterium]|nr:ECF transporter S component [Defluviitaleaceae bacterium]